MTASLVWFRQDLRLRDNLALSAAVARGAPIIPLYIWAPEDEGEWVTALGFSISYRTVDRQPDRTDRRQFSCTDKRQRFAPTSVVPLALTGVRGLHRHATVPSHRHA